MDDRTFSYLTGRFRDYYREADLTLPPNIEQREWGYIPWSQNRTVMIRHKSLLELGDVSEFLAQEQPRHVYTSASHYEEPGAATMDEKRWLGSDLIFDIDADHLPDVDLGPDGDDDYTSMLAKAKVQLNHLLRFLEEEFNYDDIEIVFSGGRGYHVHVRDESVQSLESKYRAEIVSYVQGVNLDLESITKKGRSTVGTTLPKSHQRAFKPDGGWSRHTHRRLVEVMDEMLEVVETFHEDEAIDRMAADDDRFPGIGPKKARTLIGGMQEPQQQQQIRAGHVTAIPGLKSLARAVLKSVHTEMYADIDEPVTTDVNRLIRLPGSLHGKSGFVVTRIPRDDVEAFDPFTDAIPETFSRQRITIDVQTPTVITIQGETFDLAEGEVTVPEAVGIHLMAQEKATKIAE